MIHTFLRRYFRPKMGTVEPEIQRAEQTRLATQKPAGMDSWGYYQRGISYLSELTKEGNARARELCARAVELDPGYGQAYIGLAFVHYRDILWGFADPVEATRDKMFEAAERAVALDSMDAGAHWILGLAHHNAAQYDLAVAEGRRALELNPNFALGYVGLGVSLFLAGRWGESIPNLEKAFQLNPRDARNHLYLTVLARACMNMSDYEPAMGWARKAIEHQSNFVDAHLVLASCLGHLDRVQEARSTLHECERLKPGSTGSGIGNFEFARLGGGEALAEDRFGQGFLVEGLRKAGLPE